MHLYLTLSALLAFTAVGVSANMWNEKEILQFMSGRPRAYFTKLFAIGGFRTGMEVGVAWARFSELFLVQSANITQFTWHMVEPFPHKQLIARFDSNDDPLSWKKRNIGTNANLVFHKYLSSDKAFLDKISNENVQLDFLYLDGAHDYENVKQELKDLWKFVKPGGVLAGHDYCNHGEASLACKGCENIPTCVPYTDYGVLHGKSRAGRSSNQQGVVRAVQEWLVSTEPALTLHHTVESFTRESLAADGLDYDLVITHTYNPSWYVVKPL
jgi:hypothetical protein